MTEDPGDISRRRDELAWLIEMERSPRYIIQLAEQLHDLAKDGQSYEAHDARDYLDTEFVDWLGPEPFEKMAIAILNLEEVDSATAAELLGEGADVPAAPRERQLRRSTQASGGGRGKRSPGAAKGGPQAGQIGLRLG